MVIPLPWKSKIEQKVFLFRVCTSATNLCFGEKNVYTSEVLAVVMQQLMEQNPLPILLMRTVIQSLTMYPRLGGFVMNILSRLIVKQVGHQLWVNLPGVRDLVNPPSLVPCRCGSIPRCGRGLWSAARGRSLSRTASCCNCRPRSWPACSNAVRRWESRSCSTSTPSRLTRWELRRRLRDLVATLWFLLGTNRVVFSV